MSSTLTPMKTIPIDTYHVARKVYNLAHVYLIIGDRLDTMLNDPDLVLLDPSSRLGTATVLQLALISAFQYAESMPDNLAEEATRKRMDWKYALHQSLDHPGFTADALCQFRQNMFSSGEAAAVFYRLLCFLGEAGLYSKACLNFLDTTAVLNSVCQISRVAELSQAMKMELSWLVGLMPDWLRTYAPPHWYARYANGRFNRPISLETDDLAAEAEKLGADIEQLTRILQRIDVPDVDEQAKIDFLNHLLEEQFVRNEEGLQWRLPGCLHCSRSRRDARFD